MSALIGLTYSVKGGTGEYTGPLTVVRVEDRPGGSWVTVRGTDGHEHGMRETTFVTVARKRGLLT